MANWTNKELDYLKNNYGKINSELIGERLNRSVNSIRHKANRLELSKKRIFWSEDDEIYLEYFAFENDSKLSAAADFLNHSTNAVQLRLSKIRESRKDYYICRPWTKEEDDFLRDNYKSISYCMIAIRLSRTQKAVANRVRFLGLKKYVSIVALDSEIRKLAAENMCISDIARALNLKQGNLRDYLIKHKIDHRVLTSEESLERARAKSPWIKK